MFSLAAIRQGNARVCTAASAMGRRLKSTLPPAEEEPTVDADNSLPTTPGSFMQQKRSNFANVLAINMHGSNRASEGRAVSVAAGGAMRAYGKLNRILAENNIRRELFLRKRYEKPKYKRQRLRRESHARRFKEEVRSKVHLIMKMKNWGM